MGNSMAPRKSAAAAAMPPCTGPKRTAPITMGINAKPILTFHAEKDRNLDNTMDTAIRIPIHTICFVFVIASSLLLDVFKHSAVHLVGQRPALVYEFLCPGIQILCLGPVLH